MLDCRTAVSAVHSLLGMLKEKYTGNEQHTKPIAFFDNCCFKIIFALNRTEVAWFTVISFIAHVSMPMVTVQN